MLIDVDVCYHVIWRKCFNENMKMAMKELFNIMHPIIVEQNRKNMLQIKYILEPYCSSKVRSEFEIK